MGDLTEWLFGLGWMGAFVVSLLIGFGLIASLKLFLQGESLAGAYKTLLFGDTVGLPVLIAAAAWQVTAGGREWSDVPLVKLEWLLAVILSAWYLGSIGLEIWAVLSGQFDIQMELKPSKLAHTFCALPLLGYLATVSVAILASGGLTWALLIGAVGGLIWVATMAWDTVRPPTDIWAAL